MLFNTCSMSHQKSFESVKTYFVLYGRQKAMCTFNLHLVVPVLQRILYTSVSCQVQKGSKPLTIIKLRSSSLAPISVQYRCKLFITYKANRGHIQVLAVGN